MAGMQPNITANDAVALSATRNRELAGRWAALPLTLRNYYKTLFWTIAGIALCAAAYVVEKYMVFQPLGWLEHEHSALYRMFKNPAELAMRLFGLPHFLIGIAFLVSSKRMRGVKSVSQLLGLTALGALFCWLFYRFGSVPDPVTGQWTGDLSAAALLLFYFYFLIHGFRDEAFFYKSYGDMPKDAAPTHDRLTVIFQALMMGLLVSFLIPATNLLGAIRPKYASPLIDQIFPAEWPYVVRFLALIVPMALIALVVVLRLAKRYPDGVRGLWREHYPILTVFFVSTGIIILPLATGPWVFNVVVLMHFVGWYLFGRFSLRKRPPAVAPRKYSWKWMRTTESGFTFLHIGLAVLIVILVAISHYAFGKSNWLELIVGSKVFYYWTIMHVTLSFFPR